ncbi:MAG: trypsin-like peptidase domain-containing protein [Oscillibacter sp.]|nr:trypsin-like peptidase domain-containing protein [Oscillibacter sp.]
MEENRERESRTPTEDTGSEISEIKEEPCEVVSWYIPHERGVPASTPAQPETSGDPWREAAAAEKKRSRKWGWIFALCMVVLVGVVVGGGFLFDVFPNQNKSGGSTDGGDASSIIQISPSHTDTTIPTYEGDASVRLTCTVGHGDELTIQQVYAKVNPSVVTVMAEQNTGASVGTGIIMTEDGYIITNAHVISGGKSCMVALSNGATYTAELVGYDEEQDVAVLKADANGLPAAEFGDSDQAVVGDTVYAIGNPLGVELRGTLTNGIISAINRDVTVDGKVMTLIQTNAALNNGNSGGPLINAYGQVIGINTLKMSSQTGEESATVEGLGFALPISSACFVVNDLIAYGQFKGMPSVGITIITVTDANGTHVEVYTVEDGFGAAEAGMQEGDVIVAADGQRVASTGDLMQIRRTHVVGETMTLTALRDGRQMEFSVVLKARK